MTYSSILITAVLVWSAQDQTPPLPSITPDFSPLESISGWPEEWISQLDDVHQMDAWIHYSEQVCKTAECSRRAYLSAMLSPGVGPQATYAIAERSFALFSPDHVVHEFASGLGFAVNSLISAAIDVGEHDRADQVISHLENSEIPESDLMWSPHTQLLRHRYALASARGDIEEASRRLEEIEDDFWRSGIEVETPIRFHQYRRAPEPPFGEIDREFIENWLEVRTRHGEPSYRVVELQALRFARIDLRARQGDCQLPEAELEDLLALTAYIASELDRWESEVYSISSASYWWTPDEEQHQLARLCFLNALAGAAEAHESCRRARELDPFNDQGEPKVFSIGYLDHCELPQFEPEYRILGVQPRNP